MGEYVLQRNLEASVRYVEQVDKHFNMLIFPVVFSLDAQHLLARMQFGYLLHPLNPVREGMKIADIGSGTGYALLFYSG